MAFFNALFRTRPRIQVFPIDAFADHNALKLPQPPLEIALIGLSKFQKHLVYKNIASQDAIYTAYPSTRTDWLHFRRVSNLYALINEFHRINQRNITWKGYVFDLFLIANLLNLFYISLHLIVLLST